MSDDFDAGALSEIYEIDVETFEEVIECYLSDTPNILSELNEAVGQSDANTLRERAHKLKGSSSTMGLSLVSSIAFELESIGRGGSCDQADDKAKNLSTAVEAAYEWLGKLKTDPPY
ncbi:MAG: Hpt domain-containing protein [Planctomycetes bacterium]|nr:Hpt domain-containing protein [Planctomycetota bacterium]